MVFVYIKISMTSFKLLLKIAKTDMINIKYALELFIDTAGNICKKNDMKSLKFNTFEIKKHEIKNIKKIINGYRNIN